MPLDPFLFDHGIGGVDRARVYCGRRPIGRLLASLDNNGFLCFYSYTLSRIFGRAHDTPDGTERPEAIAGDQAHRFRGPAQKTGWWSAGRRSARPAGFANCRIFGRARLAGGTRRPVRSARDN